jgi:hypothetical protein
MPVNVDTDPNRRWLLFEAEAMPHVDRLFRHAMWLERNLQSFHRFTPGTNCRAWLVSILHHVRSNRHCWHCDRFHSTIRR